LLVIETTRDARLGRAPFQKRLLVRVVGIEAGRVGDARAIARPRKVADRIQMLGDLTRLARHLYGQYAQAGPSLQAVGNECDVPPVERPAALAIAIAAKCQLPRI